MDKPAFWLTRDGAPLGQRALALRIRTHTNALLGVSVFPHAPRHGAATTLALERPELIDIATPLLQHRHTRTVANATTWRIAWLPAGTLERPLKVGVQAHGTAAV